MHTGYKFLIAGFLAMFADIASWDWQLMNDMSGTALHVTGILTFAIGIFMKRKSIWNYIKSIFTKKKEDEKTI